MLTAISVIGHNLCQSLKHVLSFHYPGKKYNVAGDITCYWATICAESTGIRCRRRLYILLGHNMCREYRHQMSLATLHLIGPQYVPRVPASDVAGDIMRRGDTICWHTCRHRPNGLVFGFDKTHISLANAIKNVYHTIFNSHGFPYQFLLFVVW